MEQHKICFVTGHRPGSFPWDYYDKECAAHKDYLKTMHDYIKKLITEQGFDYFICGGAIGVDTDFAQTVLSLKKKYKNIQLEIAVPCEDQDLKWTAEDKAVYHKILKKADVVTVLAKKYTPSCMMARNRYMVDKSDFGMAFWYSKQKKGGTYATIRYVEKIGKPYELFGLYEFTDEHKKITAFLESIPNRVPINDDDIPPFPFKDKPFPKKGKK